MAGIRAAEPGSREPGARQRRAGRRQASGDHDGQTSALSPAATRSIAPQRCDYEFKRYRYPFVVIRLSPPQMTRCCFPCVIRVCTGIKTKDIYCDLFEARPCCVRVKNAKIDDKVGLVVGRHSLRPRNLYLQRLNAAVLQDILIANRSVRHNRSHRPIRPTSIRGETWRAKIQRAINSTALSSRA